jgi:hypothetical protein
VWHTDSMEKLKTKCLYLWFIVPFQVQCLSEALARRASLVCIQCALSRPTPLPSLIAACISCESLLASRSCLGQRRSSRIAPSIPSRNSKSKECQGGHSEGGTPFHRVMIRSSKLVNRLITCCEDFSYDWGAEGTPLVKGSEQPTDWMLRPL